MKYRAEVDGLRALAVVPVIFFHAGFALFSGGFVGVDVFFVISGYLITGILISELDQGRFSILGFYERRARRILPALLFMMLCTLPFGWAWMLPAEFKDLAQSFAAAALSVSNILFWLESGYFDTAAELKPLLHTWSLGVEEQFYIFYPLLLLALWRLRGQVRLGVLIGIGLISLIVCDWASAVAPSANFYLLPFRAWELIAGGLCAFIHARAPARPNGIMAALGGIMVLAAIGLFDELTPFPGRFAILPVLGTCLILLYAAPDNLTGRLLALKPIVGIGLISYSAYLWHQPVLVFARLYSPDPLGALTLFLLALASFPLAWFSWRFIERPFRQRGPGALIQSRATALGLSVGALALVTGLGVVGHLKNGLPERFTPAQQTLLAENDWIKTCQFNRLRPLGDLPATGCVFNAGGQGKVALVGDSVMTSLSPVLIEYFSTRGFEVHQFTHSHCTANRRIAYDDIDAAACPDFIARITQFMAAEEFEFVVTAGNYLNVLSGETRHLRAVDDTPLSTDALIEDMRDTLQATGARVIAIYPHPRAPVHVRDRAVRQLRTHGRIDDYIMAEADFRTVAMAPTALLDAALPDTAIRVYPDQVMCQDGSCRFIADGNLFLSDTLHFTPTGAAAVAGLFETALKDITANR